MRPVLHVASLLLSFSACCVSLAAPPVTALAMAPDGSAAVAGSQAGIRVCTWPELKESRTLPTALAHVHDLAFSPRGDALAAAGGSPAEAGGVEVFSWPEGKLRFRAQLHGDLVYGVAWSSDGTRIATAGYDHLATIIDAAGGRRLLKLEGHSRGVLDVCFLPDGKTLVSAGADQSLRVWDAATGRNLRNLDNHTGPVHELALRPTTQADAPPMIASLSDDRTVRLWQPTLGRLVRFARFKARPAAAQWTADGRLLVVAFTDGRLRVLDPDTLRAVRDVPSGVERIHSLAVHEKPTFRAVIGDAKRTLAAISLAP